MINNWHPSPFRFINQFPGDRYSFHGWINREMDRDGSFFFFFFFFFFFVHFSFRFYPVIEIITKLIRDSSPTAFQILTFKKWRMRFWGPPESVRPGQLRSRNARQSTAGSGETQTMSTSYRPIDFYPDFRKKLSPCINFF